VLQISQSLRIFHAHPFCRFCLIFDVYFSSSADFFVVSTLERNRIQPTPVYLSMAFGNSGKKVELMA